MTEESADGDPQMLLESPVGRAIVLLTGAFGLFFFGLWGLPGILSHWGAPIYLVLMAGFLFNVYAGVFGSRIFDHWWYDGV